MSAKMLDWEVLHSMEMSSHSLVHTTNLKAYIARLITPFSYKLYVGLVVKFITKKYTSSDINFRLPSGKSL